MWICITDNYELRWSGLHQDQCDAEMRKVRMMRRMIGLILAVAFLVTTSAIAQEPLIEYRDECPHLFLQMTNKSVSQMQDEGIQEISAVCVYCDMRIELLLPWATERQSAKGDAEAACQHVYRLHEEIVAEGYYPPSQLSPAHEYRYMMVATCDVCKDEIDVFRVIGGGPIAFHEYTDTGIHFHLDGRNEHVFLLRCNVCGYEWGNIINCNMYDIGWCWMTLREMGYLQYHPFIIEPDEYWGK